jgi:hypothetical protein
MSFELQVSLVTLAKHKAEIEIAVPSGLCAGVNRVKSRFGESLDVNRQARPVTGKISYFCNARENYKWWEYE